MTRVADPAGGRKPPSLLRLLLRGLTRRCPLCGSGGCFETYFRIRPRCPRCNFPLRRIEGHESGALGMNTVVTFAVMLLVIVVGLVATYPHPPVLPLFGAAALVAIVMPIAFYPISWTLWAAIDLAMRPVDATDGVRPEWQPRPSRPSPPSPPSRRR